MLNDPLLKTSWQEVVAFLSEKFGNGDTLSLEAIIYLIGVQELGRGDLKFKKDDKTNLMHIAICKLLEPYGYYEFEKFDEDGWPHFKQESELPSLKPGEQSILMKQAVVNYFKIRNII